MTNKTDWKYFDALPPEVKALHHEYGDDAEIALFACGGNVSDARKFLDAHRRANDRDMERILRGEITF